MIRITQVGEDYFDVEPIQKGAHMDPRRLHRSELPDSLSSSMVIVNLLNCVIPVEDQLGSMVAPGVWELHDSSLQRSSGSEKQD